MKNNNCFRAFLGTRKTEIAKIKPSSFRTCHKSKLTRYPQKNKTPLSCCFQSKLR